MINTIHSNAKLPLLTQLIANWHDDRNLISGSTLIAQTSKLLEEFTELVAAQCEGADADTVYDTIVSMLDDLHSGGRIKPVEHGQGAKAFHDALGDMYVVQVNLAEQVGTTSQACIDKAWTEIKDRRGRMIDGVFVKEEDL